MRGYVRPKKRVETAEPSNELQSPLNPESPKLATSLLSSQMEILLKSCVEDLTQRQSESCRHMEALVLRVVDLLQGQRPLVANGLPSNADMSGSWPFRGCAPAKSAEPTQIRERHASN